ncbi:hypothetical protein RhiirC2_255874 [Rhizophagus irregularis]|uniref:Uncharacterized protein n=1 Tax=Rhizophagus irregularis TaxID=588596 RepID=A0A2N1NMS9_9GLOM|nr:hypothetical protein RhiirC2_255874 [Rhizophagus irregularis]
MRSLVVVAALFLLLDIQSTEQFQNHFQYHIYVFRQNACVMKIFVLLFIYYNFSALPWRSNFCTHVILINEKFIKYFFFVILMLITGFKLLLNFSLTVTCRLIYYFLIVLLCKKPKKKMPNTNSRTPTCIGISNPNVIYFILFCLSI